MDVEKKLEELVDLVVKQGGSDIHLAEDRQPVLRINGDLNPVTTHDPLAKKDME
jgi:Tfp pilus assembly pilus retraction ATPase PilT